MAIAFKKKEVLESPEILIKLYDVTKTPPVFLWDINTEQEINLIDFTTDG